MDRETIAFIIIVVVLGLWMVIRKNVGILKKRLDEQERRDRTRRED